MNILKRNLTFLLYYLIGFFGLYFPLRDSVFRLCSPGVVDLLPGQLCFFPHTRQVILFYMVLVPTLFFYFLHALWMIKKKDADKPLIHKPGWVLVISLLFNALIIFSAGRVSINPLVWLVLWSVLFSATFYFFRSERFYLESLRNGFLRDLIASGLTRILLKVKGRISSFEQAISVLFLIVLVGGLTWAFSPLVFSTPKLLNDFLDIPEKTLMNSSGGAVAVDNSYVIDKFGLCGRGFESSYIEANNIQGELQGNPLSEVNLKEFTKKNKMESCWKVLTRGFIHHHNHILAPANELALGRPVNEIFSQYGWGCAWFVKTAMSFLPNGICYGNYIRLHFFGYYFYYGLFLALLFYLFKDVRIVTILFAIIVISVFKMEQYGWLGPGASPMRHFFDLPVIFFFMKHLTSQRFRYLYATLLFCILGVIFNTQFGCILYLCVLAGLTLLLFWPADLAYKKRLILALMIGGAGLLISSWLCSRIGAKDIVSEYFFAGVLGFPIKESQLLLLGVGVLAGYLAWICIPNEVPPAKRILSLVLLWYAQIMLLYYVRAASFYMFLPIFPLVSLAIGYLVIQLIDKTDRRVASERPLIFFTTVIFLAYVLGDAGASYHNKFEKLFVRNFTQHVTYKWDMPRTHFISTMDPRYFASSIALIQKYSPDTKGIHIISKYDRFLPFISERYSAMPFIDLEWFLITQKELDLVVGCIQEKIPEYLFADTDIDRDFLQTQVIAPDSRYAELREESLWRAQRLNNLKTVFDVVRGDYEKVETSELLTVYRRKSLPETQETAPHAGK